jgi:hypothetical protein
LFDKFKFIIPLKEDIVMSTSNMHNLSSLNKDDNHRDPAGIVKEREFYKLLRVNRAGLNIKTNNYISHRKPLIKEESSKNENIEEEVS